MISCGVENINFLRSFRFRSNTVFIHYYNIIKWSLSNNLYQDLFFIKNLNMIKIVVYYRSVQDIIVLRKGDESHND